MAMAGFVLLVHDRRDGEPIKPLGITVTKKIGGAVVRNRMKRRFRALARELLPDNGGAGADHSLIGRAGGVERNFALLREDITKDLHKNAFQENEARPNRKRPVSSEDTGSEREAPK